MIYAVVGAGPRTGTSWTMEQLDKAGLPVYYTDYLEIPGAAYDTVPTELNGLKNVIVKVWPNSMFMNRIGRMVVLKRDYESQMASLQIQIEREREAGFSVDMPPERMIEQAYWILERTTTPRLEIETKDLNARIGEVIEWFSEPFEQVRTA